MPPAWQYTRQALLDLQALDRVVATRIVKTIERFCSTENPFAFAKPLKGPGKGLFRFRIGDYRAIFRRDPSTGRLLMLLILRIKHRKDVYD
jgi:mRNA interferase RelE/StbE